MECSTLEEETTMNDQMNLSELITAALLVAVVLSLLAVLFGGHFQCVDSGSTSYLWYGTYHTTVSEAWCVGPCRQQRRLFSQITRGASWKATPQWYHTVWYGMYESKYVVRSSESILHFRA